ncbi:hypothetical protein [Thiomicrorhabdus sp. Kp2]|uniref:hypothetical protein n=1 Tax=Thiomicrorhabdus sp. Kp2 TaxID=1123518 RepID=UPI00041DB8D2|nr:hypothetical protein [Thiomicrorhabdus sp. Kp2]
MTTVAYLSTSALSKKENISSKELFNLLEKAQWIQKSNDSWELTDLGISQGGRYQESKRFGQYIVWPENLSSLTAQAQETTSPQDSQLTSKTIGQHFQISANKTNQILSELGWIKKALKGWQATAQGLKLKAIQSEDYRSGIPYVRWPQSILDNKSLKETIEQLKGNNKEPSSLEETKKEFRDKFKATHRTTDGHMVRSKAEMLIDNWLYMAEIVHAYERKLPIEEDVYSDFYIPAGKVYIEYWGLEEQPKYLERKQKKIEIYKKYGFNLIELKDHEVQNLDDHLPKLLLKFGVQAY